MLKFKFDYQNQTLAYQLPESELWYQITETFEGNFDSLAFQLSDGWINFTVYSNKIRVFYKQFANELDLVLNSSAITYYRQYLSKECPVIFTFTEADQVEKQGNQWIKKGGQQHA